MNTKIKDYLGVAIIISTLLTGFAVFEYAGAYSRSAEPTSFRSFTVTGDGKAIGVPDVAEFTFSVITEGGKDIATLQKDNTAKINVAISFVKSKGVDSKDIKTEGYNLNPRYQYSNCGGYGDASGKPCPPPEIVGYTITQTVSVKVRKFENVGEIISGVVTSGANETSQLSFKVDDPTSLQNDARAEAIDKAKTKAKSIAKAGGFNLGRLLSIEEGGGYVQPRYYNLMAAPAASKGAESTTPSIEAGSQEITVNVTLKYEIN